MAGAMGQVAQVAGAMVQVDQAAQVHQAAGAMVQVDQAAQVYPAAVIPRASPVPDILRVSRTAVNRRVSRRAVIPAATQAPPLVRQWEDTQCPMVLFMRAPFEVGLNRFPTFAILVLVGGTAIGKRAKKM
jgi:hypothetical protein